MKEKKKLVIINRDFPPVKSATGFHANALAEHLLNTGFFSIRFVSVKPPGVRKGQSNSHCYTLNLYSGKNKILRLLSSFFESLLLCIEVRRIPADFLLFLTDPPFLSFFIPFFIRNQKWALWTMDLYPEAFVAGGLIGRRNILYKFYTHIIGSTSPDLLICLGQNQSAFIKSTRGYQCPEIIYPVGIEMPDFEEQSQTKARFKKDVSKLYIAYCGNLGEAHDISFLEHLILGLNSEKYVFVISAYGNYKEILRSKVSGLGYVCFCDQLNQTEMKLIDLQLVSLKREWTHISVPSRALSALKLGHHIVYFGSKESDTWQYISKVAFGADNLEDMLGYLDSFNPDDLHYLSLQSAFLTKEIEALLERARILLSNSILDICNS